MQSILTKTTAACLTRMHEYDERVAGSAADVRSKEEEAEAAKKRHLALMNASEVTVVRYVSELVEPPDVERFAPKAVVGV